MNAILTKLGIIILMVLVMIIPVVMIQSMIEEREGNKTAEQTELSMKWGGTQKLSGVILVLPYITNEKSGKDFAYFIPDEYSVTGDLKTQERIRGIQKVLNYQADMFVKGKFSSPDIQKLKLDANKILWDEACLVIGISNLQTIKNNIDFQLNGQKLELTTEIPEKIKGVIMSKGLMARVPYSLLDTKKALDFEFNVVLNGADGLHFVPTGIQTNINLSTDWKSVSFIGDAVADESVNDKGGIDAKWTMLGYNHSLASVWIGDSQTLRGNAIGIDLLLPLNHYQQTMRAVKYAILFITLTFLVFFMVEILGYQRIHPFQYFLVSVAMILFYTLLLALSEHLRFGYSYLIAAISTILLITAYSKTIFKKLKQTIFMGGFLSLLYIYLYIVLQQEDMALLLGSVGLFIGLAAVMYTSRKIDWYRNDESTLE